MIKYTTLQFNELEQPADVITGYMVELRNEYGNISCRTILSLPEGEKDIRLWLYDSVVAIPDLRVCFKTPGTLSYTSIHDFIIKELGIGLSMASALAATVITMESVVKSECEHWDMAVNLAECSIGTMDFDLLDEEDDLPF